MSENSVSEDRETRWISKSMGLYLLGLTFLPGIFFAVLYSFLGQPMRFFYRDGWGLSERAEWTIYLLGWPISIIVAVSLCAIIKAIADRLPKLCQQLLFKGLILGNALLAFFATFLQFIFRGDKELAQAGVWFSHRDAGVGWAQPGSIIIAYFVCFALFNLVWITWVLSQRETCRSETGPKSGLQRLENYLTSAFMILPVIVAGFIGFIYGYPVARPLRGTDYYDAMKPILLEPPVYKWAVLIALVSGVLGWAIIRFKPATLPRGIKLVIEILALTAFGLLLIDITFPAEPWHTKVYVMPINGVLHGHPAPNEINALYGAGMTYFLAGIFKTHLLPFTLNGMSAVNSLLMVALYLVLYFTIRVATRQRILAFMTAAGAAAWVYHAYYIIYPEYHPAMFAQGPPLRILVSGLFLLVVALRLNYSNSRNRFGWLIAEAIAIGIASVWSLEAICYTLPAYVAVVSVDFIYSGPSQKRTREFLGLRLLFTVAAIAFFHSLLVFHNFLKTGQPPHWGSYLALIKATSATEGPVIPWGPWQIMTATLFGGALLSALSIIPALRFPRLKMMPLIAGLSALGIAHFTYYLGFSMSFRIGYLLYAPLSLGALGVAYAWSPGYHVPVWLKSSLAFYFGVACLTPIFIFALKPASVNPYNYSLLKTVLLLPKDPNGLSLVNKRLNEQRFWSDKPIELLRLIDKYAAGKDKLMLLVDDLTRTDVLTATKKDSMYPLMSREHDGSESSNIERIRATKPELKSGDIIFTDKDIEPGIKQLLLRDLNNSFWMETLETTPMGVQAQRLHDVNEPDPSEEDVTSGTLVRLGDVDLGNMVQEFERPKIDKSVSSNPISIAGRRFKHGVGSHARSAILLDLQGNAKEFRAYVGVDDESANGTVIFEVEKDGVNVFTSERMHSGKSAAKVSVDLSGAKQVKLIINNGGDNSGYDHADWADAKFFLVSPEGAKPTSIPLPPLETEFAK